MKFIDLDGKQHGICIEPYLFNPERDCRSELQRAAGKELQRLFPLCSIFTEVPAIGTGLYLDYFIPSLRLCVEVDGGHHNTYNKFFHGDLKGFARTIRNDQIKEQWALKNGFAFCRIVENDIPKLKEIINDTLRNS